MFDKLFRRTPSQFKCQITPAEVAIQVAATETLLQAALGQGVPFPHNCRAGGCGTCKCRLVEGKVKELTDKSYLLSAEEIRDNYILACQSIPRSDLVVSVELGTGRPEHPLVDCRARIAALDPITHDIIRMKLALDHRVAYTPGQYAELTMPTSPDQDAASSRSYSFASCPEPGGATNSLDFYIRKIPGGSFTEWLFQQARPGVEISFRGPYGDFFLRPGSQPIVCIAGGSGLAPIKAMLEHELLAATKPRDLTLFFGARSQDDLYIPDTITRLAQQWPGRFEFVTVLSAEPEGSGWEGRRGLIHEHLQSVLGDRLGSHHAYLCGPPGMIDACVEVLGSGGTARSVIHFDKFLDRSHLNPAPAAA